MIELRSQYIPSSNPADIWVIMDDDYNSENAAPGTTSGAILLPSPHTMINGQDTTPDVQYSLYADDLRRPEVRNFLISIIVGSIKNHLNVYLCPGTSPVELFLNQLLTYITQVYGVIVGGETGLQPFVNPAYFDAISMEANAFGIECNPYLLNQWLYGPQNLIKPFGKEAPHACIFKDSGFPF